MPIHLGNPATAAGRTLTDALGRRYELLRLLGEGGFGEVYLARVRSPGGLDQHVAVKLLHRGLDPRGQAVERLRDEARLLASLRHPVILAAHDLVEIDGKVALVTEFIEGEDLAGCIDPADPGGRMPAAAVLDVVERVASALDAAWRQLRVVHRDVKPANIRIGVHANVKLLDFGIARSGIEVRAARTESQMLVGTMRYLAPERFDPRQAIEPASDVFALGCVLYEGVTGDTFFGKLRTPEIVRLSIAPEDWTAFVERRLAEVSASDAVRDGVQALLRDMLAHVIEARPSAGDVARRCEELTSRAPGQVRLTRWCRDHTWAEAEPPAPSEPTPEPPVAPARPERAPRHVRTPPVTRDASAPTPAEPTTAASLVERTEPLPRLARVPTARPAPSTSGFRWAPWAAGATAIGGVVGAVTIALLLISIGVAVRSSDRWFEEALPPEVAPVAPAPAVPESAPVPVVAPQPKEEVPVVRGRPAARTPAVAPQPPPPEPVALPEPSLSVTPEPVLAAPMEVLPTRRLTLASVPGGAEVRLVVSGELLGTTPLVRPLPMGEVAVRFTAPDGTTTERTLRVSPDGPGRYVWYIADNRLDAGN